MRKIYRSSISEKVATAPKMEQSITGRLVLLVTLTILTCLIVSCREKNDEKSTRQENENETAMVIVQPAPKPTDPVPMDVGCVTTECHAGYISAAQIHKPVQENLCSACHEQDKGNHTFPVKINGNQLCLTCHDTGKSGTHRHSPIDDPGCTGCHDPHVSETTALLKAESVQAQCGKCHEKILRRVNHEPFDQGFCTSCHDPHESDNDLFLIGGVESEHCFTCHKKVRDTLESKAFDHAGIAYQCSACHSAHSTDLPNLLKGTPGKLCASCHARKVAAMENSQVGHDAVLKGDRCFQCHAPHGSDQPGLLRAGDQTTTCLKCHDAEVTTHEGKIIPDMTEVLRDSKFRHGPLGADDCVSCHTVHGGSERALLMDRYSRKFFADFDLKNFALCFDCHSSELVTVQKTTTATEFRNGTVNLHYLHINREKRGSSCRSCHAVHGSNQPRLIAQAVPYEGSKWLMPIRFALTPTGGRCAPACHEPMSYSRSEVKNENSAPTTAVESGGDS